MAQETESASLGSLFSKMSSDVSELIQKEIQLAKVETKEEISRASKAGGKLGAAALTGYLAVLFASLAIALLLDQILPSPLAFAIVALAYGAAAFFLQSRGREELKTIDLKPEQTVDTLKEDIQWAKTRKN